MSIVAAIPISDEPKMATIEPASASPHFLLCNAYLPTIIGNIPGTTHLSHIECLPLTIGRASYEEVWGLTYL